MQNKEYYIQEYNNRPTEEELMIDNDCIGIKCRFPKTIKKGFYIKSCLENGILSFDAAKEYYILKYYLKKPFDIIPVSGRWEGTPFLIRAKENIIITLEDEKVIQDHFDLLTFI